MLYVEFPWLDSGTSLTFPAGGSWFSFFFFLQQGTKTTKYETTYIMIIITKKNDTLNATNNNTNTTIQYKLINLIYTCMLEAGSWFS